VVSRVANALGHANPLFFETTMAGRRGTQPPPDEDEEMHGPQSEEDVDVEMDAAEKEAANDAEKKRQTRATLRNFIKKGQGTSMGSLARRMILSFL
jgi:hypothetical protein